MKIYNRKARHTYHILETFEAGIVLSGFEVKAIRAGRLDLSNSFARIVNGEVILKNAYIHPYQDQKADGYDPRADRKLLLHASQIRDLSQKLNKASNTLVPLSLYEKRNMFKVELALGASKKKYDHRRAIKERDELRKIEQDLRGEKV
ncbi:MAG: SsrA-binding protein [uncultured bacterium]|uniref:SsrA-binding protein n=3 Tax=Candidatus Daviesiibacteriota TaxID=1752718 RepID=A0A0G0H9Y7_9BACT|nr:MAG: SsrA-binding protein [uncultured bacterium]KKQ08899.1 MAG: SsrA-binding protein [Candidatus Daviesbacteria bacterium GW2011_GWB1_36_5]KKQ14167.1 MAG: SsrA-binding protein [Candidatus Daviesbacteria bacterium GW2011_GWA1_36_8]OGE32774.1 MAG: SsrA-binding protein [Candidatus Daviesbacteria bacterium RIFCSPHIGHO2_02_FULL_37_9]OGE34884.1 MAG: SsrA-binding protein [Candidatus Daviesbacteria bacterium RIFCSPHIGHO2_12_FULL_37_16]